MKINKLLNRAITLALTATLAFSACVNDLPETEQKPDAPHAIPLSFTLPAGLSGFGEKATTRGIVPGFDKGDHEWEEGDELMASITIMREGESETSTIIGYAVGTTLVFKGTDRETRQSTWIVKAGDDDIVLILNNEDDPTLSTNKDTPLLKTAGNNTSFILPSALADAESMMIMTTLFYAPGMKDWTIGAGMELPIMPVRKADVSIGTTPLWLSMQTTTSNTFAPETLATALAEATDYTNAIFPWFSFGKRLRIYTGRSGDEVQLFCPQFFSYPDERTDDDIYTATTGNDGNAYFYGYAEYFDSYNNELDGSNGKEFVVTLKNLQPADGSSAQDVMVFKASANNTVCLEVSEPDGSGTGLSYAIDASWAVEGMESSN